MVFSKRMIRVHKIISILTASWAIFLLVDLYASHHQSFLLFGTDAQQIPLGKTHPPCWHLEGANDTLVVLRTGATEFIDKFPIHLETTLQCYPNYVIFSDHEEIYRGEHVRDALNTVDPYIRQHNKDFELYRRLQQGGREVLESHELSGNTSRPDNGGGKGDRPGWRLDKWKFLPMLNHTYSIAPNMKWYVFVETDTYLFWATMLKFQAQLDHTKKYYMSGQIYINNVIFAHGGSGFLVSNAAIKALVEYYVEHQKEIEDFTASHWAGDCVLGKTFADAGVPLTLTWPIIQGDSPGVFPFGRMDNQNTHPLWCYPITTYHHISSDVVAQLWDYEQDYIADNDIESGDGFLRNRDVFINFIMPQMRRLKYDWDNDCKDEREGVATLEDCKTTCLNDSNCLQYRFDKMNMKCSTSSEPKLGEEMRGSSYSSGWLFDRIEQWKNQRPECGPAPWIE